MRRKALLRRAACDPPPTWAPYLRMAEQVGLCIQPVQDSTLLSQVDTGDSPGDVLYLRGTAYIDANVRPISVLHEVFHYMVAKAKGKTQRENFGSTDEDELLTCDLQITWSLVQYGAEAAVDLAHYVNYGHQEYRHRNKTLSGTLDEALPVLAAAGFPVNLTEAHRAALAEAWGVPSADTPWCYCPCPHCERQRDRRKMGL